MDLLHDVNESLIPKTLNKVFAYCVQQKFLSKNQIIAAVRDFNYGNIDSQKKPSVRDLDRLGQSASQLYTIMTFLPFILRKQRDKLKNIWICVETALQVMQILFSSAIAESDVCALETLIDTYLSNMQRLFDMHLTPKLHFLTHYPNVIRDMGPVIHSWTMRMESKHKTFTDMAKKTNNFKNIAKTLATKHQQRLVGKGFTYIDLVKPAKNRKPISKNADQFSVFKSIDPEFKETSEIDFFYCNSYCYRPGFLLTAQSEIFEIHHILLYRSSYSFICKLCKYVQFDSFFNSIEFERSNEPAVVIRFEDLKNKQCYERIAIDSKLYVKCDTLDVQRRE